MPEAYLDQRHPTDAEIFEGIDQNVRDTFAYLVKINRAILRPELFDPKTKEPDHARSQRWETFGVADLFELKRGDFHSIDALGAGPYPTISRIATDHGFVGFHEKSDDASVWQPKSITVSTVTADTFVQPEPFIVTDNVVLGVPKSDGVFLPLPSLFFVQFMLNAGKWRYSYGRQCYKPKFSMTKIRLPVTDNGNLDHETMAAFVEGTTYWPAVKAVFDASGQ